MNWLERYVGAVKRYLPKKNREDLGEEIMSVMQDKLDAEQDSHGGKMSDDDIKAWLSTQDHPMVVAAAYGERPEIVPRELYPPYFMVLKIVAFVVLGLTLFGFAMQALTAEITVTGVFTRLLDTLTQSLVWAFGSVTLVFHLVGRKTNARALFRNWKVDDLPEPGGQWQVISVPGKITEIVFIVFFLALLNSQIMDIENYLWTGKLTFGEGFENLLPVINAYLGVVIVHRLWLIARRRWNVTRLVTNVILTGASLYILSQILQLDPLVTFTPEILAEHPKLNSGEWLDKMTNVVFYVIGIFLAFDIVRDLYRIYKLKA